MSTYVVMWQSSPMQPRQFGWSIESDWRKFDTWPLEICWCSTTFVQAKFGSPNVRTGKSERRADQAHWTRKVGASQEGMQWVPLVDDDCDETYAVC